MRPYIVRQGDTVKSIVAHVGGDPDVVWTHPDNSSLRAERKDPAVLRPGDILFVPDNPPPSHALVVGGANTFSAPVTMQTVRLILRGEKPLAGERYVIQGLGSDTQGTTDDKGALSVDVPIGVASFVLELPDQNVAHEVLVGHLDPAVDEHGADQRLVNMGFGSTIGPLVASLGIVDVDPKERVRLFQVETGRAATGELDEDTLSAIQNAHGA